MIHRSLSSNTTINITLVNENNMKNYKTNPTLKKFRSILFVLHCKYFKVIFWELSWSTSDDEHYAK